MNIKNLFQFCDSIINVPLGLSLQMTEIIHSLNAQLLSIAQLRSLKGDNVEF